MHPKKNQFLLNADIINTVSKISDELAGKLFKHILGYVNGENPKSDEVVVNLLFIPIEQALLEESQKSNNFIVHCKEAGKKSAELRKLKNESPEHFNQRQPTSTDLDQRQPTSTNVNQRQPTSTDLEIVVPQKKNASQKINYSEIIEIFNRTCESLPKARLTTDRVKLIDKILLTYTLEEIGTVFTLANENDYLSGRKIDWRANFNWIFNPTNFVKILEGNYQNIVPIGTAKPTLKSVSDAVNKFFN